MMRDTNAKVGREIYKGVTGPHSKHFISNVIGKAINIQVYFIKYNMTNEIILYINIK